MRRTGTFPMVAALAVATLGLAGCGSKGEDSGFSIGNLNPFKPAKAPVIPIAAGGKNTAVDCPIVQIPENAAAYRVYAGADKSNASVKYQFSLGEVSRDCSSDGSTIDFRLGISGYVQAGPAGGAGSYAVPLKVSIKNEESHQDAATKVFRIEANIPPGETQAVFSLVTDPISVPFISSSADEDYGIYIGFDQGASEKPKTPEKPARKRKSKG